MKLKQEPAAPAAPTNPDVEPSAFATALAVATALAAAWITAGSVGLLGHALRHALTFATLLCTLLSAWPHKPSPRQLLILAASLLAAGLMLTSSLPVVNITAVALILAALAWTHQGHAQRVLLITATAVITLALWRLAYTSIHTVWSIADSTGRWLGVVGSALAARKLWVGATFAGLDFLLPMIVLAALITRSSPTPRWPRALWLALAILVGHFAYLAILAVAPSWLPPAPKPGDPAERAWLQMLRPLIPWNLPALAALVHATIAASCSLSFRERDGVRASSPTNGARLRHILPLIAALAAIILALLTNLWLPTSKLENKKIVLFEKGFLNWLKPTHGDYGHLSIGMYGMLEQYLPALGAKEILRSPDLSEQDLKDASLLIMLFPDKKWEPTQEQLNRIDQFVRNGGSLLLMGEHTVHEAENQPVVGDKAVSRFNQIIEPTGMYVRFDSATFQVGGWLQSYETLAHPTTAGIPDDRNQFGVVIGASVAAPWPAKPVIVGRWGWADPGDVGSDSAMMGNHRYDPGEKLGDLVLAAERPWGRGRIMVFGDTSSMTNGITVGSHVFTSRLLSHLAGGPTNPQSLPRQFIAAFFTLLVLATILWRPDAATIASTALSLGIALPICVAISHNSAQCLPTGQLAYITTSHLESSSDESWRPDGTMGLAMTFMRSGYLTLSLPELTEDRLAGAKIVTCVAPMRPFSRTERNAVRNFVENGGIFILTAGYDASAPSRELLNDFGLFVGSYHTPDDPDYVEPMPLGHFKSPYLPMEGGGYHYVRFHAAWPIGWIKMHDMEDVQPIAYGAGDVAVILLRRVGQGKIVLIGDTGFAMNKNLENKGGEPFEGMRENADFWRWFISYLTDQPEWRPPHPQPATEPTSQPEGQP